MTFEKLSKLNTWGGFSGDAGDAISYSEAYNHNGQMFTTPDKDHDNYGMDCKSLRNITNYELKL